MQHEKNGKQSGQCHHYKCDFFWKIKLIHMTINWIRTFTKFYINPKQKSKQNKNVNHDFYLENIYFMFQLLLMLLFHLYKSKRINVSILLALKIYNLFIIRLQLTYF